jgi:hypothetical protein
VACNLPPFALDFRFAASNWAINSYNLNSGCRHVKPATAWKWFYRFS